MLTKTLENCVKLNSPNIIIATHIPPFPECCWYNQRQRDENWQPFLSSKATGDILMTAANNHPEINFLVVCGHTHTRNRVKFGNNLEVKVGHAQYRAPDVEEIIELDL